MEYIVYKHTLQSDGRVYIGQTYDVNKRWRYNGAEYKDSPHFWNAIKKYGWDAFSHEILFDHLSKEEADRIEDILINEYCSMEKDKGFNLRGGGSHGKHCERSIRIMSEKAKLRGVPCGEKSPMYGKHHSAETKEKMSQMRKGEKHPRCKKVAQINRQTGEVIKVFPYIKKASEETGINNSKICGCCRGKRKSAGGYFWEYIYEDEKTEM